MRAHDLGRQRNAVRAIRRALSPDRRFVFGDEGIDLATDAGSIECTGARAMTSPFERLVATLDYPLCVVTTAVQTELAGCLVGFATQCSIHPSRFLACLSNKNHTFELARRSSTLAVHVIEEKHRMLAEIFGGETGDEVDKFARVSWHYAHGIPILDACERWFVGSVLEQIPFGDHVGFLLEPIDTAKEAVSDQLTFQQARNIEAGHRP
jgi:flavin reductase (DIM6/NTAB) family NADH-FMN oxidoreductase RutF